jgi:hypothetical protein
VIFENIQTLLKPQISSIADIKLLNFEQNYLIAKRNVGVRLCGVCRGGLSGEVLTKTEALLSARPPSGPGGTMEDGKTGPWLI